MTDLPSLEARQPDNVWNRAITVNTKDLFKALMKGGWSAVQASNGDTTKIPDVIENIYSAFTSMKLNDRGADEKLYILVENALCLGVVKVAKAHLKEWKVDSEALDAKFEESLVDVEIKVTPDFFQRPRDSEFLAPIIERLSVWLCLYISGKDGSLALSEAKPIAERLRDHFALALHEEWAKKPAEYKAIFDVFDSPFKEAMHTEYYWWCYEIYLRQQVEKPIFEEDFGLEKVFVPLRAYYVEKTETETTPTRITQEEKPNRHAVDLKADLRNWLHTDNKKDYWRIISGGPGRGKSSLAAMLATELFQNTSETGISYPIPSPKIGGLQQELGLMEYR